MSQGESFAGARVTIMGLGLHGGGASAARFFARKGADVTVTDLREERELSSSVEKLKDLPIRFVLGNHEVKDFEHADMVIKNPAVPRTSSYLARARRIETDISIFLKQSSARLVAITGSKGKSSTSAATHHILSKTVGGCYLGGNITYSPLEFIEEAGPHSTVVLELSSFQLGDLTMTPGGIAALTPQISMITSIFPDHLDYYAGMEEYVADKRLIYAGQGPGDWTIARDDDYGRSFLAETPAKPAEVSDAPPVRPGQVHHGRDEGEHAYAYLDGPVGFACTGGREEEVVPERLLVTGVHMRRNLLAAALGTRLLGVDAEAVREAVSSFPGIGHRLEHVRERGGIHFYNDSAATIPEATLEAVSAFAQPVHLIAGGSDKNVDFGLFAHIRERVARLYLLEGSAVGAITAVLENAKGGAETGAAPADPGADMGTGPARGESGAAPGVTGAGGGPGAGADPAHLPSTVSGPFPSLESALGAALSNARPGEIVILSPGCASFGMFQNEFDRGRQFRDLVADLE